MLCLGIESSCDETALALTRDGRLLVEAMASQAETHAVFGGVVPELAGREHYRALSPLLSRLLAAAETGLAAVDLVAVARGPGLLGSLLMGVSLAKGIALGAGARLVGVNHLHAHLLAPGLEREILFPALGLLVSGGHTHLYRIASATDFELLGRTLDDAAGECFDKVAKTLNLPYPGGRRIDLLASAGRVDPKLFPRPYLDNSNLDFSFSGLKTSVATYIATRPTLREAAMSAQSHPTAAGAGKALADLCASFNWSVAETLRVKTERALSGMGGDRAVKSLIVAGGVAANSALRLVMAQVAETFGLALCLPSPGLCTDNAAMVAYAGERLAQAGLFHGLDLEATPRGRVVPLDYLQVP